MPSLPAVPCWLPSLPSRLPCDPPSSFEGIESGPSAPSQASHATQSPKPAERLCSAARRRSASTSRRSPPPDAHRRQPSPPTVGSEVSQWAWSRKDGERGRSSSETGRSRSRTPRSCTAPSGCAQGTLPFVSEGLAVGLPVAVAAPPSRLALLKAELGPVAQRGPLDRHDTGRPEPRPDHPRRPAFLRRRPPRTPCAHHRGADLVRPVRRSSTRPASSTKPSSTRRSTAAARPSSALTTPEPTPTT